MQRKFNKIFQIGFNKCGTTSIHNLFVQCGLKSVHHGKGIIARKICYNIINNKKMLDGVDKYDCYTDIESVHHMQYPFITHYKLLDEQYPNSLFILNTRPINKWIESRLKNYLVIYKKYSGINNQVDVIEAWTKEWNNHHEEVLSYFRHKENFLWFDIENEPEKIIEFLKKWGLQANQLEHLNKTKKEKKNE